MKKILLITAVSSILGSNLYPAINSDQIKETNMRIPGRGLGRGGRGRGMGPGNGQGCNQQDHTGRLSNVDTEGSNKTLPGRGLGQGGKGRGMGPGKGQGCDNPDHTGKSDK